MTIGPAASSRTNALREFVASAKQLQVRQIDTFVVDERRSRHHSESHPIRDSDREGAAKAARQKLSWYAESQRRQRSQSSWVANGAMEQKCFRTARPSAR